MLETFYLGNSGREWLLAGSLAVALTGILRLVVVIARGRLRKLAEKTTTHWDDMAIHVLGKTKFLFLFALGIYVGARILNLPDQAHRLIRIGAVLILLIQAGVWANSVISFWIEFTRKRGKEIDRGHATTIAALAFVARLAVWAIILLLALDNLGINVTALITGLGIGGIAIALAVQNILGDLLASLSIIFDKPFVVGDFLIVDDMLGAVEEVGLKTTRLRSLSGEQLVFSNNDLLKSRIRNYGRMYERRVLFSIGVTYDTPRVKLAQIPTIIRRAIESQEKTRFDRSHFKAYGDFALQFESVYYVLVPEYTTFMDIQQAINLKIHEDFEAEGIVFAFPTQTIHLAKPSQPI